MLRKLLLASVLTLVVATGATAASLEIDLNDFSAQGRFLVPITEDTYGTSQAAFRLLYNDHKELTLGSAGFDFLGKPGNVPGLDLGVGVHVYGGRTTDGPDQDLLAVGLGATGLYTPPVLQGFGFGARFFYAPKILSFADAERLAEAAASAHYAITPRIRVFTEYQFLRAKLEDVGSKSIDEGLRVGFQAQF